MLKRNRTDWAVIFLAVLGLAIMACGRIMTSVEESTHVEVVHGHTVLAAGLVVAFLSIVAAVQWKLIEIFFAGIRWINRRDDPRHQKQPAEPP